MSTSAIRNPNMIVEPMRPMRLIGGDSQPTFATPVRHISSSVQVITPSMAARWLEGNLRNRKPSPAVIERYAEEMRRGRWRLTHQGIAFSSAGTLVDGQHRLMAIIKADVPVEMTVTHGIAADAILAIDQNRVRRAHEQFSLKDGVHGNVTKNHIAILRAMISGLSATKQSRTLSDEFELYQKHAVAVQFAMDAMPSGRRNITVAPVQAVFARAFYCADPERLNTFGRALVSGVATDVPCAETIGTLATFLTDRNGAGGDSGRTEVYGKTCRALHAWLRGERLTKLYMPTHELFLLPD